MKTEHIKKVFESYLNVNNPQSALLINGKWGSGKTYFWKFELAQIATNNNIKAIYLSLNGLSKIEQLEHLLFLKLLPIIRDNDNKMFKAVSTAATNILNIVSKRFLTASLSDILNGVSIDALNLSKYLIVMDDLERCQIPLREVLGYINNYIEHRQTKILILADESNIDTDNKYDSIKEKAIGRILNFNNEITDILPVLIKRLNFTTGTEEFFRTNLDFIIGILKEFDQNNLRIITFFLDQLCQIIPFLNHCKEGTIKEVVFFSAIIAFEFKTGELKSVDFKNDLGLANANFFIIDRFITNTLGSQDTKPIENKSYAERFALKYLDSEKRSWQYHFFKSIYSFILSGYLDTDTLKSEILLREPEISKEEKAFNDLFSTSFFELTTEDFSRLISEVQIYAEQGKYSIYRYSSIASQYFYLSKNQIITLTVSEVFKFIRQGLEKAKVNENINDSEMGYILNHSSEDVDVNVIKNEINKIHVEIQNKLFVSPGNSLLKCIKLQDIKELNSLFYNNQMNPQFFKDITGEELAIKLLNASNVIISRFNSLLESRYNIENIDQYLNSEIPLLQTLAMELNKNNITEQPKKFNIENLSVCISKGLANLEVQNC